MLGIYDQNKLQKICKRHDISYLGLFGSYARGEQSSDSDIDLLVEYERPVGLLTHAHVQNSFSDFLNKKVDLVIKSNLKTRIKPYIMKDLQPLYEKR